MLFVGGWLTLPTGQWARGLMGSRRRGLSGIWIEEEGQLLDGMRIIFALAAYVTDPGWKLRHGDELIGQPSVIRQIGQMHLTSLAIGAGLSLRCVHVAHINALLSSGREIWYGEKTPVISGH
jgi:hypothetical protein